MNRSPSPAQATTNPPPSTRDRGVPSTPGPAVIGVQPGSGSGPAGRINPNVPPGLIPIDPPRARPGRVPEAPTDPIAFWDNYFRTHDETAVDLLETVSHLGHARKFDQVEGAIRGFLRHRGQHVEPWMYESLAVALDLNKRGPDQVRTALGYAAWMASRSNNPDQLVLVADLLLSRGIHEPLDVPINGRTFQVGAGALLDRAIQIAPHLPAAPMMAVNLGRWSKDPARMGKALEDLLSLGWPDADARVRFQVRREVEALAKDLRQEGRAEEADALLARLAESEGRDLFIRLSWEGDADLDLLVREPLGAIASHRTRRTVFGGALIEEGVGRTHAEEVYSCPRGFDGDYTIQVDPIYNDPDAPIAAATLEIITHEGRPAERKESRTVDLKHPGPIVVHLADGRRKTVLPFLSPAPEAPTREK